ncbi:MAG: endolytic transglycosylase MltG [Gammaproteobacteria bacterium]|nr:endolytic transglycosylase MltG [Gammaproteobacteria bacterium]
MRWLLFAVTLLLVAALSWGFYGWRSLINASQSVTTPAYVLVEHGDSLATVARKLEQVGVIDKSWLFEWFTRFEEADDKIQAGEYEFEGEVTLSSILLKLTQGSVVTYDVQLAEGARLERFLALLTSNEKLVNDLPGVTPANIVQRLRLPVTATHGEGLFFPDTYSFRRGEPASSVLRQAFALMEEKLDDAWASATDNIHVTSKYELLIVASMVERESHVASDRARISGVIHRRLGLDMYLQIDPTVIYAVGDKFRGRLTWADLRIDSLYNTYKVKGLPPSPICAPSAESLFAAAQPTAGKELYFVSRGDGTSEFSETLQDHNRAVARYINNR